jgi:hypothetical protein
MRDSSAFGGYVASPSPSNSRWNHSEDGTATFMVPTLSCADSPSSSGELQIGQFMDVGAPPNGGNYTGASVVASCDDGESTYSSQLNACGEGLCMDCPTNPVSVAPGTEVTVSVDLATIGGRSLWTSTISDESGDSSSCPVVLTAKFSKTPIFTGVCVFGTPTQGNAVTPLAKSPTNLCSGSSMEPTFTPVDFSGVKLDDGPLARWSPQGYDVALGSTVQVKTGALKDDGESFKETFVHE